MQSGWYVNGSGIILDVSESAPELVNRMVLLGVRTRSDYARTYIGRAMLDMYERFEDVPVRYQAVMEALCNLSPRSLEDEDRAQMWLELFEATRVRDDGMLTQMKMEGRGSRTLDWRKIVAPVHVVAFKDDMLCPWRFGQDVAHRLPNATFEVIGDCGHIGYLKKPDLVNEAIVRHLGRGLT